MTPNEDALMLFCTVKCNVGIKERDLLVILLSLAFSVRILRCAEKKLIP